MSETTVLSKREARALEVAKEVGMTDEQMKKLMQKLLQHIPTQFSTPPQGGTVDDRGRGLEHDSWKIEFHEDCPTIELVANAGRLYAYCPGHRCFALVCYETSFRIPFVKSMSEGSEPPIQSLLDERKRRAAL